MRAIAQQLLEDLIAVPSLSGTGNEEIIVRCERALRDAPLRVRRFPLADAPARWNLLIEAGPSCGRERSGLLLSGHLDVVPANEPEWTGPPFALRIRGDRMIGRGTADMKGFVALAIDAVVRAAREPLTRPLALLLTADEEVGSIGARDFCRAFRALPAAHLPRRMIIGEPTSMEIVRQHLGHTKVRFTITGRAAHSGSPHLGRNAIEPAAELLSRLTSLREALRDERSASFRFFPETPYATLNVARITGGEAFNIIPDRCTVDVGVRPLPGMDPEALVERLRAITDDLPEVEMTELGTNPPLLTEEDDPFVLELCELLSKKRTHAAPFASDGGFLARELGGACVLLGPGSIEVAHRPDEWLSHPEWRRASDEFDRLIQHFCR